MHKKRYWIIGIAIFIIFLGAVFGDPDEQDSQNNNNAEETNINEHTNKDNNNGNTQNENNNTDDSLENEQNDEEYDNNEENEPVEKDSQKKNENTNSTSESTSLSDLQAHFIDVGQADATLFQYKDGDKTYNILFDTGDWNRNDVVNYLKAHSISKLDVVIISHPHADHIGQLANIMEQFTVDEVWMSGNAASSQTFQRAAEAVLTSGANYEEPRAGEVYDIGPLTLEVLHPARLTGGLNEDSISIRFLYGGVSFVLTGDAYKQNELEMMSRASSVKAQILHLGHHGSNTSTDASFVQAVNPNVAIYSASANNSYGHPHAEVVSLIQKQGIDLYGTDVHGTIVVTTDGKTYTIATQKDGTISPKSTASSNKSAKGKSKETSSDKDKSSTSKSPPKKENKKENPPASSGNCIDINSASIEEVQKIIHIGPERAGDLVKLRPYNSVNDLTRIKGIGPARITDIKEQGIACLGG